MKLGHKIAITTTAATLLAVCAAQQLPMRTQPERLPHRLTLMERHLLVEAASGGQMELVAARLADSGGGAGAFRADADTDWMRETRETGTSHR